MPELPRTLGLWGAASVGIGAIIGTGIFVLIGVAAGIAGPSVILSFIIAGFTAMLTGLSAAEISSFIHEAGGSYIYATKAFGKFPGFLVGWLKTYDYIVGTSAVSVGFAAYFAVFLGINPTVAVLTAVATIWPLMLTILNLRGMQEASGINAVLVLLKVSALVLFILIGGAFLLTSGTTSNYSPFFPHGISGTLSGAAVIFFAFIGFNTVAVIAEEVRDPGKTVPRAILISFGVSTLLYIGITITAVGLIPWTVLGISTAPLEAALRAATNNILALDYLAVSALFATTSVILASILGGSRALFAMAREGTLPKGIATVSSRGVPSVAVLMCGIASSVIVFVTRGDLSLLASVFNFGTLVTYFFINASLLQLRRTMPDAPRLFRVPLYPFVPVFGLASCIFLSLFLNMNAVLVGLAWILVGIVAYQVMQRRSRVNA
ncbi:MAG: amino acid permease [Methanomicrobiales archaeon]|nr:amino acid permease [Methanomicrobiales archaeon]